MKPLLFSAAAVLLAQTAFSAGPASEEAPPVAQLESQMKKAKDLMKAAKEARAASDAQQAPIATGGNSGAAKDCAKEKCTFAEAEATCPMDGLRKCLKDKDLSPEEATGIVNKADPAGKCSLPDSSSIEIKYSLFKGKVYGVTATTKPQDAKISQCAENLIRGISWPAKACDCNVYTYTL